MSEHEVWINRAAVLTLWAAIVAERLGFDMDTALTMGRAVAGLNAQSKGQRLGIYGKPGHESSGAARGGKPPDAHRHPRAEPLLGRLVPVAQTPDGLRAVVRDKPEDPDSVKEYLNEKFGDALPEAKTAMRALAKAYSPERLAEVGFSLYEEFRPKIPAGVRGWGAKGRLDLDLVRELIPRR